MKWRVHTDGNPPLLWHFLTVAGALVASAAFLALDSPAKITKPGFVLLAALIFLSIVLTLARVARYPVRASATVARDGARVLCVATWRRVTFVGVLVLWLGTVLSRAERGPGWEWLAAGFLICFLVLNQVLKEQYRLTELGIARMGGIRPHRRWEWGAIKQVVAIRDGIFLTDTNGREVAVSALWFDGYADLASDVLRRVRPDAFPNEGIRLLIQRQAAGHTK